MTPSLRSWALILGVMTLLVRVHVHAQEAPSTPNNGVVIQSISPSVIYVPNNGKQVIALIKGSGLERIQSAAVIKGGKVVQPILTRLGPVGEGRVQLYFMAAPPTPLGSEYQLKLVIPGGDVIGKIRIEVVAGDDSRAHQTVVQDIANLAKTNSSAVVFADAKTVPTIIETVPTPLAIKADGSNQKLFLKGTNLEKVTEIRVRRAEKASIYAAGMGKLPFDRTAEGIALELSASEGTPLGKRYALDLIVGDYVATSVIVEVVAPAP